MNCNWGGDGNERRELSSQTMTFCLEGKVAQVPAGGWEVWWGRPIKLSKLGNSHISVALFNG